MILGLREEEQMPRDWKIADDAITTTRHVEKERKGDAAATIAAVMISLIAGVLGLATLLGSFGLLLLAADWVRTLW